MSKLQLLRERGFIITKDQVFDCLGKPDRISLGQKGRKIAQKQYDDTHVIRVVFAELDDIQRVITVYPARRDRYENEL